MPRLNLYAPLRFNLTGYDRQPAEYPAGEQDVPEVVAEFVVRHGLGEVIAAPERVAEAASESESAEDAPAESDPTTGEVAEAATETAATGVAEGPPVAVDPGGADIVSDEQPPKPRRGRK